MEYRKRRGREDRVLMPDISRETHQRRQRDKENLLNSSGEEGKYNFIFYSHLKNTTSNIYDEGRLQKAAVTA